MLSCHLQAKDSAASPPLSYPPELESSLRNHYSPFENHVAIQQSQRLSPSSQARSKANTSLSTPKTQRIKETQKWWTSSTQTPGRQKAEPPSSPIAHASTTPASQMQVLPGTRAFPAPLSTLWSIYLPTRRYTSATRNPTRILKTDGLNSLHTVSSAHV